MYKNYECPLCGGNTGDTEIKMPDAKVLEGVPELLEMIRVIPCQCDSAFKDRKLTDPDCPRCNWVDEDTVNKVIQHFQQPAKAEE